MRAFFLALSLLAITTSGCKQQDRTVNNEQAQTSETFEPGLAIPPKQFVENTWCFAEKTPSDLEEGQYNYHLIKFRQHPEEAIAGVVYHFPYGTDSFRASIKGVIHEEDRSIDAAVHGYAEGEHYQQQARYKLLPEALELGYQTAEGTMATLPKVSCREFDSLLHEYQQGVFEKLINTTDRTRLKELDSLKAYGFTEDDLDEVRFMERAIDLDRDPSTTEHLIYLIEPSLCGTGGCNLLVVDSNNTIVADITVTRLPIFTTIESFETLSANKGSWKDLFVYSKGMRRLSPENGVYPTNPSVEEEIMMEQFTGFPENYLLLMDHLD